MTEHDFPLTLPDPDRFALHRRGAGEARGDALDAALGEEDFATLIDFDPVPRLRVRRDGWTPERQILFIVGLALCGSVAAAARMAGLTRRGAYRLLEAPGATGFARAWDAAVAMGYERTRGEALDRAINGVLVRIYRRGKLVRVEERRSDRLAIALLSGRDREPPYRWQREDRATHRADQREYDAASPAARPALLEVIIARIDATCAGRRADEESAARAAARAEPRAAD